MNSTAPADGFADYHARRATRVRRIVEAANANAKNYHMSGLRRDLAHGVLRVLDRFAPATMLNRFDWLYGADVTRNG
jgi:salicylate hydroxylase